MTAATQIQLSQNAAADEYLSRSPLALLVGMLLDQQFPMERAFFGPYLLAQRLGHEPDAAELAAIDPERLATLFTGPPAVHRFPAAMAGRVQRLARHIVEHYDGQPERIWTESASGAELLQRLRQLPGYGEQKARIFLALLGKRFGVRPTGWRKAAGPYGAAGSHRSIADVTDAKSLRAVREFKRAAKAAS